MKILVTLFTAFVALVCAASDNNLHPFVRNYELPIPYRNHKINSIASLPDQTILISMQKGVLSFDGVRWQLLTIPEQPGVLYSHKKSGSVFLGCESTFGIIGKRPSGELFFQKLIDTAAVFAPVLSVESIGDDVYFLQPSAVSCYNTKEGRIVKTWKSDQRPYEDMFVYSGRLFVSIVGLGTYELQETGAKLIDKKFMHNITVSVSIGEKLLLIDIEGRCFIFDGNKLENYDFHAKQYVLQSRPTLGINVPGGQIALGTQNAGVIVLDIESGKVARSVNYQTGMADDEVRGLYLDANNGLWVGHANGVSRADLSIPIADFSIFPGLQGSVQNSVIYEGLLYVGTSDGVFYLSDVKDYNEIAGLTRVEKSEESVQTILAMKKVQKVVRVSFQNKSGKGGVTKDIPVEIEVPYDSVVGIKKEKFSSESMLRQYVMHSLPLQFKKIPGFSAKCLYLCPTSNGLLAGTNNGLFRIKDNQADTLLPHVAVRQIIASTEGNYFALSSSGLLSFATEPEFELISMNENMLSASSIDFYGNTLWVTEGNMLKKIRVSRGRYLGIEETFRISDYFPEDNIVANIKGLPTIFTYADAFIFDAKSETLERSAKLSEFITAKQRPIHWHSGNFWVKGNDEWLNLKDSTYSERAQLLNVFDHIQDINADKNGNLWAVADGRLFKLYGDVPRYPQEQPFPVSINSISSQSEIDIDSKSVNMQTKNFGLKFHYSSKYYLAESKSLYRYRLLGLNDEWSEWTSMTAMNYPYIPGGRYVLELESRNVVGQMAQIKPVEIIVHIPFWEQWWFYLIFGGILVAGLTYVFASKTVAAGVQMDD
jgi:hypothetical protein